MKIRYPALLTIFALFVFFSNGFTQNFITHKQLKGKLKKSYDKALTYNRQKDYNKALKEINKLLKEKPNLIDAHIQKAYAEYDLEDYAKAEKSFEKALEIGPSYKAVLWYQLALSELNQKKYLEAVKHFEHFIELPKGRKIHKDNAKQHISYARLMAQAFSNPIPFDPKNLGSAINSPFLEYLPALTADQEYLVFTRRDDKGEDFFFSQKKDGNWQKARPITPLNTRGDEGAQSISADGRLLVFAAFKRKAGYGNFDLYYSESKNGKWTAPKNMGSTINSSAWESQPSISANGNMLYFASKRKGGIGGQDIWMSKRKKDGSWGTPQNLGPTINTSMLEGSPFLHPDGQTLYFMSNGHPSLGKTDLYFSRLQEDGSWGTPQNLGHPINTKENEGALIVSLDGTTAYYAAEKSKIGDQTNSSLAVDIDIYSFELYPEARPKPVTYVKAKVIDAETKEPLTAEVEFTDLGNVQQYASSVTDEDGTFLVCLPLGKNYALNVFKKDYLFHSENFALRDTSQSLTEPFLLEIELTPIREEFSEADNRKPIILKNVFFETGSAQLMEASTNELDRLTQLLEEQDQLKIQINGHTDNIGSDKDNLDLSERRAKAVYTYLIDKGISTDRLSFKGFGETKPIDTNDSQEGRSNNRRTEFVVIQ